MRARTARPRWVTDAVDDRILAAGELEGGDWVVLTRTGATLVAEDGVRWQHPWHEIERGEWDGETHTLSVHLVGSPQAHPLVTREEHPRSLPLVFRERVDASVVLVENEPARGGGTLRAAVRRTPDGDLLTQVLAVGRVRRGPDLDAQIDALETKVRDAVGM